jgi:hypothetical protein
LTITGQNFSQSYAVTEAAPSQAVVSCTVNVSAPAQIASEGRTEVLGNLVLSCTGLTTAISADIKLNLNTQLTNASTDAPLLTKGATSLPGQITGSTGVHWPNVTLGPGDTSLTVTNVRGDASLLSAGVSAGVMPVTGVVKVNSTASVAVTYAAQAASCGSYTAGVRELMACASPSMTFQAESVTACPAQTTVRVHYRETAPGSFHTANASTSATRLRLGFSKLPQNVQISVPAYPLEGMNAQLYSADSNGNGGSPLTSPVLVSGGNGAATWVVLAADSAVQATFSFDLSLTGVTSCSDVMQILMDATLAPVFTPGVDTGTPSVPRYRDFGKTQKIVNLRITASAPRAAGLSASKPVARSASTSQRFALLAGSNMIADVTATNDTADQRVDNTTVSYTMPPGVGYVSCVPSVGTCGQSGSGSTQVNLQCGTLPAGGGSCSMSVTMSIPQSLPDGSSVIHPTPALPTCHPILPQPPPVTASSYRMSSRCRLG